MDGGSTVCEMGKTSSSLHVVKVCSTSVDAHPAQLLLHQQLLGETTLKSASAASLSDCGVSASPNIRRHLVGERAAGVG
eukprot:5501520-Amphidinium_carterae.2